MRHIADDIAEFLRQIDIPSAGERSRGWETDRSDTCEIVVQRGGTVKVGQCDFADTTHSLSAVPSQRDEIIHIVYRQLIQQLIPTRIIILGSIQIRQTHLVSRTSGWHGV